MQDTIWLLGKVSSWYTLVVGNGKHCWAEWPVVVVMLCYVMLCYAMLCYVMLCYAMLCYAMLCYVMLCHVKLFLLSSLSFQLFLCALLNLQECGLLVEVEPVRLFGNIQDLVRLHTALWTQVMLPALEKARHNHTLLDPTHLHQGFDTVSPRCSEMDIYMHT